MNSMIIYAHLLLAALFFYHSDWQKTEKKLTIYSNEILTCRDVKISFESKTPLEDIHASSEKGVSAINVKNGDVYFKIDHGTFEFPIQLMQEHYNENYMESEKFPFAEFKGKLLSPLNLTMVEAQTITIEGKLSVHGVTKGYKVIGNFQINNNKLTASASLKVKVADHNIKIPTIMFAKIAEEMDVKVSAQYDLSSVTKKMP